MSKTSYEVPFSLGDKVCAIREGSEMYFKTCELCEGIGNVIIKEKIIKCPDCYGHKGSNEYKPAAWHISYKLLTIGEVRLEHQKGKPIKFIAMCKETGVGSGTLHNMDTFFSSIKEAQKECDNRNKI